MTTASGESLQYDPKRLCPKCDNGDVSTTYRHNGHEYACRDHRVGVRRVATDACDWCHDEHFDRHCRRCGFDWREDVRPPQRRLASDIDNIQALIRCCQSGKFYEDYDDSCDLLDGAEHSLDRLRLALMNIGDAGAHDVTTEEPGK
jgi:hypothetical protein